MKKFKSSPETQIEFGKAIFNLANLVAVVVFFSQITKSNVIDMHLVFGGIFTLIVLYLYGLEQISSGEELKENIKKEKEISRGKN